MKSATWFPTTALILALLPGCAEPPPPPLSGSHGGPGIGPFDANGNYREDWADDPSKWRRPSGIARNDAPPSNSNPLPPRTSTSGRTSSASNTATPPRPSSSSTTSKPPQPRPSITRHTVKRGDTLSAIAKRYGSSVAAIRKANGISGHLIHPGQRLVVPRP